MNEQAKQEDDRSECRIELDADETEIIGPMISHIDDYFREGDITMEIEVIGGKGGQVDGSLHLVITGPERGPACSRGYAFYFGWTAGKRRIENGGTSRMAEAMTKLTYTTELPTDLGWFLYFDGKFMLCEVVDVCGALFAWERYAPFGRDLETMAGKWAGPLEEPE